jgi:glycosyltransferase involved in cell wall biosynthesis
MKVTVAICTWNRCDLLQPTLEQLTRMVRPSDVALEILVVNNNCTDGTDAVVSSFLTQLPLRRLFEATPGLSHARNAAIASSADADYLVFTDDDVLVDPRWLIELRDAALAFPEAAAIGGIIDPWFPEPPNPELTEAFPVLQKGFCGIDHQRAAGPLPADLFILGANMAYRRDWLGRFSFNANYGVSPTSIAGGEEVDMLDRIRGAGGSVIWWPNMRVQHYVAPSRMTREYLLKFIAGKGKELVLAEGRLDSGLWFGAPRWLWRERLAVSTKLAMARLTTTVPALPRKLRSRKDRPTSPSRAVGRLIWAAEDAFLRGMVTGYRQLARKPRDGRSAAGSIEAKTHAGDRA